MIIHIAIENGDGYCPVRRIYFFAIHGVGIWLRDDANTCPSCVPKNCNARIGCLQHLSQQIVCGNCIAHVARVVTQLADFGCCLVHKHDGVCRVANTVVGEQRIRRTQRHCGGHFWCWRRKRCRGNKNTDAGGISSAHFHAVDCRKRLVNCEVPGQRRSGSIATSKNMHGVCCTNAITANGPRPIAYSRQTGNLRIERGSVCMKSINASFFDISHRIDQIKARRDVGDQGGVAGECANSGVATQQLVGSHQRIGDNREFRPSCDCCIEQSHYFGGSRCFPRARPGQDANDAAHIYRLPSCPCGTSEFPQ